MQLKQTKRGACFPNERKDWESVRRVTFVPVVLEVLGSRHQGDDSKELSFARKVLPLWNKERGQADPQERRMFPNKTERWC